MNTMYSNKDLQDWEKALLSEVKSETKESSCFYKLVHTIVNEKNEIIKVFSKDNTFHFTPSFTNQNKALNFIKLHLDQVNSFTPKTFMLGDLIDKIKSESKIKFVFVNPVYSDNTPTSFQTEEIIVAPLYDQRTNKLMTSSPDEALALIAIHPNDQKRFGIEMVFHIITDQSLKEQNAEMRKKELYQKIKELTFIAPRLPIKKGSSSVFCILLNMDNALEEAAFIRNYKLMDQYSDVIFVNSSLELMSGDMDLIKYDGEHIDTVFTPIIEWQQKYKQLYPFQYSRNEI